MAQNWKGCMRKVNAYEKFLAEKQIKLAESGISVPTGKLNSHLFGFQRDVVSWALRKGRAAMFLDCGMGKLLCSWSLRTTFLGMF